MGAYEDTGQPASTAAWNRDKLILLEPVPARGAATPGISGRMKMILLIVGSVWLLGGLLLTLALARAASRTMPEAPSPAPNAQAWADPEEELPGGSGTSTSSDQVQEEG